MKTKLLSAICLCVVTISCSKTGTDNSGWDKGMSVYPLDISVTLENGRQEEICPVSSTLDLRENEDGSVNIKLIYTDLKERVSECGAISQFSVDIPDVPVSHDGNMLILSGTDRSATVDWEVFPVFNGDGKMRTELSVNVSGTIDTQDVTSSGNLSLSATIYGQEMTLSMKGFSTATDKDYPLKPAPYIGDMADSYTVSFVNESGVAVTLDVKNMKYPLTSGETKTLEINSFSQLPDEVTLETVSGTVVCTITDGPGYESLECSIDASHSVTPFMGKFAFCTSNSLICIITEQTLSVY